MGMGISLNKFLYSFLKDAAVDIRLKQALKNSGDAVKLTKYNKDDFLEALYAFNHEVSNGADPVLGSRIIKEFTRVLADPGTKFTDKLAYLQKFAAFIKVFEGSTLDETLRELGSTFENARDTFLEKYDAIKAWVAIPQEADVNPYFDALNSYFDVKATQKKEKESLEAIVYLKGITYLDAVLDLTKADDRQYSAQEVSRKLETIVEFYNVVERNLVSELPPDLREAFTAVMAMVTGRKIKVLTLGIHEKTREISAKNTEINELEDDLHELEQGKEACMMDEGEQAYDPAMLQLIKESKEAQSKCAMDENIRLIRELLSDSTDYAEYKRKMAELNTAVDEIVAQFNEVLLEMKDHVANPLIISEGHYTAAREYGLIVDRLYARNAVPDLDEFLQHRSQFRHVIDQYLQGIQDILANRVKEERVINPTGELTRVVDFVTDFASTRALSNGLVPIESLFYPLELDFLYNLFVNVTSVGRVIVAESIDVDDLHALKQTLEMFCSVQKGQLEKKLASPYTPVEERDKLTRDLAAIDQFLEHQSLEALTNEHLDSFAKQPGFPAPVKKTLIRLASPKFVLNKNTYNLPGIVAIRENLTDFLNDLQLVEEIKAVLLQIGKYLEVLDSTSGLARELAATPLRDLPRLKDRLDEWATQNQGRFTSWNTQRNKEVQAKMRDIKGLVDQLYQIISNENYATLVDRIQPAPLPRG